MRRPWTAFVVLALAGALLPGSTGAAARAAEPERSRLISLNSRSIDVTQKEAEVPERLKASGPPTTPTSWSSSPDR